MQWYPLVDKSGATDKPRGDICLTITWEYVASPVLEAAQVCGRAAPAVRLVYPGCVREA